MIIAVRPPFLLAFVFILCSAAVGQTHWKAVVRPVGSRCASQISLVNHACSFLMLSSTPPPMPPRPPLLSPPAVDQAMPLGRHRRGSLRRHRGHHHSPEEEICCQWMKEVDNRCVCDMFANLPPFLARPLHQYTVMVGESCFQTFQCGSVIRSNNG